MTVTQLSLFGEPHVRVHLSTIAHKSQVDWTFKLFFVANLLMTLFVGGLFAMHVFFITQGATTIEFKERGRRDVRPV